MASAMSAPDSSANGGGQWKGQCNLIGYRGPLHRRSRGTYRGGRSLDKIRDRFGGNEPATSNDHAREAPRAQQVVDRIAGNATQERSGFLDGI